MTLSVNLSTHSMGCECNATELLYCKSLARSVVPMLVAYVLVDYLK